MFDPNNIKNGNTKKFLIGLKKTIQFLNGQKNLNIRLFQRRHRGMADKHVKRCSTLSAIKEIQTPEPQGNAPSQVLSVVLIRKTDKGRRG